MAVSLLQTRLPISSNRQPALVPPPCQSSFGSRRTAGNFRLRIKANLGEQKKDGKKFITKEEEPQQYWQTAGLCPKQMAGVHSCVGGSTPALGFASSRLLINRQFRSLAKTSASKSNHTHTSKTPTFLKLAVGGVTELLRLFSPSDKYGIEQRGDELSISGVDDVLAIIKSDYEQAYFLTGNFTSEIYADDCVFEDPTIKFQVY